MVEYVGKVELNLENYKGVDLYSDGIVEDEILEIVKKYDKDDFDKVIKERCKWPIYYHLSEIRGNCVEWLDISKDMDVLEIGSGCGAITGTLAKKAKSVTCIELSKKRSLINAERNKDLDNIQIVLGNFKDIKLDKKFDIVTLIGVLEYSESYIGGINSYEKMIKASMEYLKPNGKLIIAIENKFGLKYWAGCKEDHIGKYYESIEGYKETTGVKTFTKIEFEKMFKNMGIEKYEFYYPYPDYKFPLAIYSDEFLPEKGSLNSNLKNFDDDRLMTFNESRVYDTIIENGLFPLYSNSFIITIEG